jgi:hypothetical protein
LFQWRGFSWQYNITFDETSEYGNVKKNLTIMKYGIAYFVHDYGYKIMVHLVSDSIGSSTAQQVADLFKKEIALLPGADQNVFWLTFKDKTDLYEHSIMSVISNETGEKYQEASESLKYEVMNKIKY